MIRITTLLWIALLVVAGGTVIHVSDEVRRVARHRAEIAREAEKEQEAIRILGAEWSTLVDPHRIDDLAHRYLTLETTPIQRVAAIDMLPFRSPDDQAMRIAGLSGPDAAPAPHVALAAVAAPPPRIAADHGSASKPKDHAPARPPAPPVRPAVLVRAAVPASPGAADDGVGMILARLEHRE